MISPDEFYRQTNDNFKTVLDKVDGIQEEVSDLKGKFDTHIAVGKALEKQQKKFNISRRAKFSLFLGIIPISLAIYNFVYGF